MTLELFNTHFQVTVSKYAQTENADTVIGFSVSYLRNGTAKYFEVSVPEGNSHQETVDAAWESIKETIKSWATVEFNKPVNSDFTPNII